MRVTCLGRGPAWVLALLLAGGPVLAQSSMGTVNGTVTDPTGAAVPGAMVTLVNQGTNVASEHPTNRSGFVFVNVRPGSYGLTVELPGFNKAEVAAFSVGVNETVARNVALKVGAMTETVQVRGRSDLLQSSTADLGNVVEERVIKGVPLQGRNFTQLLLLAPGVNPVSTAQGSGQNGVGKRNLSRQLWLLSWANKNNWSRDREADRSIVCIYGQVLGNAIASARSGRGRNRTSQPGLEGSNA